VAPALDATLARLEQTGGRPADPGQASLRATAQMAAAVTSAGQDLHKPLGVLDGLTEYYRHRGRLRPADFERLLARVEDEAAQISSIIDALARGRPDQRTGPDQPGPPGRPENVGAGA
jgi:hypothetical protein